MKIKAVFITNGVEYIIHGTEAETSQEMFKAITPIWHFDPATETVHYMEIDIDVPDVKGRVTQVTAKCNQGTDLPPQE